jgi:integrase
MPYFKKFKVNEINAFVCEEFSLSLKGLAPDTKNKVIFALKEIFKPLVVKGVLAGNPADGVELFRVDLFKRETFTRAELDKLYPSEINKALDVWGSTAALAWGLALRDSGCRPSEAAAWTWEDYSDKWGGFTITKTLPRGENNSGD